MGKKKTKVSGETKELVSVYIAEHWDPNNNLGLSKSYKERREDVKEMSKICSSPEATIYMSINYMVNIAQQSLTGNCPETTMVAHGHEGPKWCRELVEGMIEDGVIK